MVAFGISLLALTMAALVSYAAGRRVALVIVLVLTAEYSLAASGVLRQWERLPPPMMVMMAVVIFLTVRLSRSGRFDSLPTWVIVVSQAFRLPLELTMHRAYAEGLMPVQMSYSGHNFDILSGLSAIIVGVLAWRGNAPRWLLLAWNMLGTLLLAVIVTVAIVSTPMMQAYGPAALNTWVADPPFVWLPGVLVPTALLAHLVLWRRLLARRATP